MDTGKGVVRRVGRLVLPALAIVVAAAGRAEASALTREGPSFNYATRGTIGTEGITGRPVVRFVGIEGGTATAPADFSIGQFVIDSLPEGTTTTYAGTPFQITFEARSIDGKAPTPGDNVPLLGGELWGQVGGGRSILKAFFAPSAIPADGTYPHFTESVPAGVLVDVSRSLYMDDLTLPLVPSSINGGLTAVPGTLAPAPVPEPSSVACFIAVAAVISHQRWRRHGCRR